MFGKNTRIWHYLQQHAPSLVAGVVGGLLAAAAWGWLRPANSSVWVQQAQTPSRVASLGTEVPGSFATAAAAATEAVVFIKSTSNNQQADDFWSNWDFFGNRGPITSAGSGVILTPDGYVVTNNHVIANADKIEVSLHDKHTYTAKVVGTDPNTDLALLKIDAKQLKPIVLANSDQLRIGDWVLAIGNPFNLNYTVTAGIISAKGRNINVVNSQFPIESFIQTDAAINPGNSGGALVNPNGELIGINTAIATRTGAYNGYGFAIPVNIVRKVVKDLTEHGEVQRAFLGAEVVDIDSRIGEKITGADYSGVYVAEVEEGSAATEAGLRVGDVILKLNDASINTKAEYLEQLSYYRPGDKINISYRRGQGVLTGSAVLKNQDGALGAIKRESLYSDMLGASFVPLSKAERQRYRVQGGYRITGIRGGRIAQMGLQEGFIIISVNQYVPDNTKELVKLLEQARGRIVIEGVGPRGDRQVYSYITY